MMLLVDIGNTRIKSATLEGKRLNPLQAIVWRGNTRPEDEFPRVWAELSPKAVLISNVGGDAVLAKLQAWVSRHWPQATVTLVSVSASLGKLHCAYPEPDKLGVDRWVAIRGAVARFPAQAVLVLDIGTAATCDLVSAEGKHLGGAIFPGVGTMRRALAGDTARLDVPAGQVTPFARNTQDAIAGGTAFALAGALERFVAEAVKRCEPHALQVVMTGGEAELLTHLLNTPHAMAPDLVLEGLAVIASELR